MKGQRKVKGGELTLSFSTFVPPSLLPSSDHNIHPKHIPFLFFPSLSTMSSPSSKATTSKTYGERVASHSNQAAKDLLLTMERKKTNLCVSVDVTTKEELLKIVEAVGESCCCVKVSSHSGLMLRVRKARRRRGSVELCSFPSLPSSCLPSFPLCSPFLGTLQKVPLHSP